MVSGVLQSLDSVLDLFWAGRGFGARAIASLGVWPFRLGKTVLSLHPRKQGLWRRCLQPGGLVDHATRRAASAPTARRESWVAHPPAAPSRASWVRKLPQAFKHDLGLGRWRSADGSKGVNRGEPVRTNRLSARLACPCRGLHPRPPRPASSSRAPRRNRGCRSWVGRAWRSR